MTPASDDSILSALSASKMYRDYERAFTRGTGLPLRLHEPDMLKIIRYTRKQENPFCTIMTKSDQACAACYTLQRKVEEEAQMQPKTLKCFAGMCETAVPVRVGENLIAFLHTGQILLQRQDTARFNRIAATLIKWGWEVDLKRLEEAYFATRVLTPAQYESLVRLLAIFAKHLAECSQVLAMHRDCWDSPTMTQARSYIEDHSGDDLSLGAVARVVNMSATYFSEKFKEATGINFVECVARARVEKARNLLQNPKLRISEIAFEVGFQSLSQFNRAFKRVTGEAPGEHRRKIALV